MPSPIHKERIYPTAKEQLRLAIELERKYWELFRDAPWERPILFEFEDEIGYLESRCPFYF